MFKIILIALVTIIVVGCGKINVLEPHFTSHSDSLSYVADKSIDYTINHTPVITGVIKE
jgi:hypothetical protein